MKEDVAQFNRGCILCYKINPNNRNQGLYHPLPIPMRLWESISMDFVGGITTTRKGHDYLFVVVDIFKKMCILMPCKNNIIVHVAVNMFYEHV